MTQQQLRAAHDLIEQGRIADARQLLKTLDDPTARLWLTQLDAARRSRSQGLNLPLPLLVAIAVVIGIVALIVILWLTPTLLTRIQNRSENAVGLAATEESLYAALAHYCKQSLGYGGEEPCLSWTEQALRQYHGAALACVAASGVDTPEARAQVGACLAQNGVPPPL